MLDVTSRSLGSSLSIRALSLCETGLVESKSDGHLKGATLGQDVRMRAKARTTQQHVTVTEPRVDGVLSRERSSGGGVGEEWSYAGRAKVAPGRLADELPTG